MIKFAHIADVHLGGWKYPELQKLNIEAFKKAIEECIKEKVNFVVISGDLFDSAMPSIDVLKEAVGEFKKLKEAGIPCYLVAGSHDFSVTGKTIIEVLEKAGFCKDVGKFTEKDGKIFLNFFQEGNVILSGVPGKRGSLEIELLKKIEKESRKEWEKMLKIFIFHTTLTEFKPVEMMPSIEFSSLPQGFDYYAGGHLHITNIIKKDRSLIVYPGPLFPNNVEELEKLKGGNFLIVTYDPEKKEIKLDKKEIKFNDVVTVEIEVDGISVEDANSKIKKELSKLEVKDKILILKIFGCLSSGKTSEIDFESIKEQTKEAYILIKNTNKLSTKELELEIEPKSKSIEELEREMIEIYSNQIPEEFSSYSKLIYPLLENLNFEKNEEERKTEFEKKVIDCVCKILGLNLE